MCNKTESLRLFEDVEKDLTETFTWWDVDDKGNINFKGHTKTFISVDDLVIGNLLTHVLSRKRNENEESANSEFYFAFMLALKRAGYKKLTIDIENLHNPIIAEKQASLTTEELSSDGYKTIGFDAFSRLVINHGN